MFRKIALASVAALTLAACTAHEQRVGTGAGLGAGAGAITGTLITGNLRGAAIGAAAGAAAGAIIGHVTDRPGYCYARDPQGRTVVIQCPAGY
jgi:Glycine zipper